MCQRYFWELLLLLFPIISITGNQINDSILLDSSKTLNNIGVQYYNEGDYQIAEEFYLASYSLKSKLVNNKNSIDIANSLYNLSTIKNIKWDYDSALLLMQKAITIYNSQAGFLQTKSLINTNIGLTYKYLSRNKNLNSPGEIKFFWF